LNIYQKKDTRYDCTPTTHEQRMIDIFNKHSLTGWKHNFVVSYKEDKLYRRYRYDIAFPELLIDIEFDGWEHSIKDRIETDMLRDSLSNKYGWIVLRIKTSDLENMNDNEILNKIYNIILEATQTINERKLLWNKNPYLIWNEHRQKKILRSQFIKLLKQKMFKDRIKSLNDSNINFQKRGWSQEVSKLWGICSRACVRFIKKYMPELYKQCNIRKSNNKSEVI